MENRRKPRPYRDYFAEMLERCVPPDRAHLLKPRANGKQITANVMSGLIDEVHVLRDTAYQAVLMENMMNDPDTRVKREAGELSGKPKLFDPEAAPVRKPGDNRLLVSREEIDSYAGGVIEPAFQSLENLIRARRGKGKEVILLPSAHAAITLQQERLARAIEHRDLSKRCMECFKAAKQVANSHRYISGLELLDGNGDSDIRLSPLR